MTNWQMGKYLSIIALHNDTAKNSLWRSTSALTLRTGNNSGDRKGKGASFLTSAEFLAKMAAKCFFNAKKWFKSENTASTSKGFTKSPGIDKNSKRKLNFTDKLFQSWNKAKSKLTEEEYNKRRRTNAHINCGEVEHKFFECPKPKP